MYNEHNYKNNFSQESDTEETYSNRVVNNYGSDNIIRVYHIDIPFSCSYNRSQRVGDPVRSYQLSDYTIDKTLDEEGAFIFSFDMYDDNSYATPVASYPFSVGLNDPLYFAAHVSSGDDTIQLFIDSCRATATSVYDAADLFEFIISGYDLSLLICLICLIGLLQTKVLLG